MSAIDLIDFGGSSRTPMIRQSEASECALACLAMVASHHGLRTDLLALRRRFQLSLKGATLKQVMQIAGDLGFSARPLRGEVEHLRELRLPVILHWDMTHFVVLTKLSRSIRGVRFHIHDPAVGVRRLTADDVSRHFTGVALELVKSETFEPRDERSRLRISQLWSRLAGFWPTLAQLVVLSAILQIAALAAPFYLQVSIDTVFPSFDRDLLWILALGFGGLALVSAATSWLRASVLLRFGSALSYQILVNLFRHLLHLPLPWFEKRHVGDVISRFGATQPIVDLLSRGLIAAMLDGVMAILTFALMALYSPKLAAVSFVALIASTTIRLGFIRPLMQRNIDAITASAAESSSLIESVRGIATIKAFGDEENRQRIWQHRKAESVNAQIRIGRLGARQDVLQQVVMGLERVAFIALALNDAMAGALTIGMIFALQSYKQQFLDASLRLVEQGVSLRLLDVELGRIADIALSPMENSGPRSTSSDGMQPVPVIELRDVHFRYADGEPDVLTGINLRIEPGEMVALVGPSGGGKTTLMKIMMGLFTPTQGEVLIDGKPLPQFGLANWRSRVAAIAQDDSLFAGSLMDNITLFDPAPDLERVIAVAEEASIRRDIEAMPLRFDTLVGDMGSALSGGQKQRILLARALYREPKVLFLDEATAHLDMQTEALVLGKLADCCITRVAIAHRTQSIMMATRIMLVDGGKVQFVHSQCPHVPSVELAPAAG